jgi:hypothetical protein
VHASGALRDYRALSRRLPALSRSVGQALAKIRITVTATALTTPPVAIAAPHVNAKSRRNCLVVMFMAAFHQPILSFRGSARAE